MSFTEKPIHYRLNLQNTADSTGFFAAVPDPHPTLEEGFSYLRQCPNDSLMHNYLLGDIGKLTLDELANLLDGVQETDCTIRALLLEAVTTYDHLSTLKKRFPHRSLNELAGHSPLIYLRSELEPDQVLHRSWADYFNANLFRHRLLPSPKETGLSFPVEEVTNDEEPLPEEAHLKQVVERLLPELKGVGEPRPFLTETIAKAEEQLRHLDIFQGPEMRHQSSLSPIALLRKWRFFHHVNIGRLKYTLSSVQTSYGRGLSLEAARVSCLMEVVERCSSFAGVDETGVVGTLRQHPLIRGSLLELSAEGIPLLDPNDLSLEVPYHDEPLYWMEGERLTPHGLTPIWVPVQCVFLFCNLDERSLFSGLGSTGLASGNRVVEARLSALYELLERDSEAVNPYHPSRCFRVHAKDEQMNALFEDYRARGIHVFFQDTSPAFGIPCCTCFVTHRDGVVVKGGGVNLNGKRAVLSALTEVPYPYPAGPPSLPAPPDLPWLEFETLPDFSTGIPEQDLLIMEETLLANGHSPIYVDITRKDLKIPVVKALIPGLEIMADFDAYSRINPRLFNNYLAIQRRSS